MLYKSVITFFIIFILTSCRIQFEQEYYERISGIQFPDDIEVVETFDNGEFYTATTIRTDSISLRTFLEKYQFNQRDDIHSSMFFASNALKRDVPDFTDLQNMYFKLGEKGKNSWIYIVDLKRKLIWAEIHYPDWGGD